MISNTPLRASNLQLRAPSDDVLSIRPLEILVGRAKLGLGLRIATEAGCVDDPGSVRRLILEPGSSGVQRYTKERVKRES